MTLRVTQQAGDLTLLTLWELRVAVGLDSEDSSQDDALMVLGDRVAARITDACTIARDGAKPPTLREEGLIETLRFSREWVTPRITGPHELRLSRRPIASIGSVTENGVLLVVDQDFEVEAAGGRLLRLTRSGHKIRWHGNVIVVAYAAGWQTVPQTLKYAAEQLAVLYFNQAERGDPGVRLMNIPDVITERYSDQAPGTDPDIPGAILEILAPYMNVDLG
jgi:hypothetical protein